MKSRRSFLSKSLLLAGSSMLSPLLVAKPTQVMGPEPSLNGKNVLFTYGGWDGHEPEKWRDYLVPWLKEEGAQVTVSDVLKPYTDTDFMKSVDLVIQIHTMSSITEEEEKGLLQAVKDGTGMAGWHGGMCDAFRQNVAYQFMTGGQWVAHPGGVIDYSVQVVDQEDYVTKGLENFPMKSEQYYMHVDPNVKVLATTKFSGAHNEWIDGCVMPVAWKKMYGKGRVFFTSLGHNLHHVTEVPQALTITKRGLKWASESKYREQEEWISPVYG